MRRERGEAYPRPAAMRGRETKQSLAEKALLSPPHD